MGLRSGIISDGHTPPSMSAPDLITSPYHQTRYLGATVTDFSGKLGFGSNSSDISISLIEDTCAGTTVRSYGIGGETFSSGSADSFIMPPMGTPSIFTYGSFQYGGLIKNVERSSSISKKGYSVRLESPTVVLSNAQVILQGLDDASPASSNIINLHPSLKPPQKSWCNDVGVTWSHILSVIEGHTFSHRGHSYTLLCAGAVPGCDLRFSGDNVDVMSAIDRAAKAQGLRIFVELSSTNVIKIFSDSGSGGPTVSRVSAPGAADIDEGELTAETKLVKGSVYRTLNTSSLGLTSDFSSGSCATTGNVISLSYGVEAGEAVTHAMVNGAFKELIYQVEDTDKIKQHYGFDPTTGDLICPETYTDPLFPVTPFGLGFTVDITLQAFYKDYPEDTYHITELEIRAAEESYEVWYEYCCLFKPDALEKLIGAKPKTKLNWPKMLSAINNGETLTPEEANNAALDAMAAKDARKDADSSVHNLHEFVSSFGQFYGKKFAVLLPTEEVEEGGEKIPPVLCCSSATDPPNSLKNTETTDGGWPIDEGSTILGLEFTGKNATGIEIFKTDEGKVGSFVRYAESDVPKNSAVDVARLETDWWSENKKYYIISSVDSIIEYPCGDAKDEKGKDCVDADEPFQFAAIVDVSGGLRIHKKTKNKPGGPVRGLANALAPVMLEGVKQKELDDKDFLGLKKQWDTPGGHTLANAGLASEPMIPDAVVVPLQSRELAYGPYVDDGGDAGKAEYEKDDSLSPWNFNGYKIMDIAGMAKVRLKTSGKTILESGNAKFTGLPNDAGVPGLGSSLGGAACTSVNFNLGVGGVTTSLTFRTFVPNFGALAQSRIEFMETMAKSQQKFQRAFHQKNAERKQKEIVKRAIKGGGGGEGGKVADKQANAHGGKEFGPRYMGGTSIGAVASFTGTFIEDPNKKANYPSEGKYTTVVAEGIHQMANEADLGGTFWKKAAGVGLEALFRPFQITQQDADFTVYEFGDSSGCTICPSSPTFNAGLLDSSHNVCCSPSADPSACTIQITSKSANPFMTISDAKNYSDVTPEFLPGNDMRTLVYGNVPPSDGLKPIQEEPTQIRPLGLKGPVVIVGWGYDTKGSPVPAEPNNPCKFADDWLVRPDKWKAGPLDVRWDDCKKMWVANPPEQKQRNIIVYAKLKGDLDPGGTQQASPQGDGGGGDFVVTNRLGQPLCSGQHIFAYFNPDGCEWVVMQAEFMPTCVVTDLQAYETSVGPSGSTCPGALDLAATTRIIYTQTPPTIGVETRWANTVSCSSLVECGCVGFGLISVSPGTGNGGNGGTGTGGTTNPCDLTWATSVPGYDSTKTQMLGHEANATGTCPIKWFDVTNC